MKKCLTLKQKPNSSNGYKRLDLFVGNVFKNLEKQNQNVLVSWECGSFATNKKLNNWFFFVRKRDRDREREHAMNYKSIGIRKIIENSCKIINSYP